MKRFTSLLLILLLTLMFAACDDYLSDKDSQLTVVATLFPQYDFAKSILGEKGSAVLLLPPGTDSHSFEISLSTMDCINSSDIFVYTGPHMEIWVDDIVDSISDKVQVINLSENIDEICHEHEEHEHCDAHIWTDIQNAKQMLKAVYIAISSKDSNNAEYYEKNYLEYDKKLDDLHETFLDISAQAKTKKMFFSGKFAFAHFAEQYGYECYAPFNSCSDIQVESISAINKLISDMKHFEVKYIFYEELSNNPVLSTIVSETGVVPLLLHSAHNVSKEDFDKGISYIDIMTNNATNLRKALCDG